MRSLHEADTWAAPHPQSAPRGTSGCEVVHDDGNGPLHLSAEDIPYILVMLADWSKIRQLIPLQL